MSVTKKFMLALMAVLVAGLLLSAISIYLIEEDSIGQKAQHESSQISDESIRILGVIDAIMSERVKSSMRLLREYATRLGEPQLGEQVAVNGTPALNLYLGEEPQANNFALVDKVTQIMGGSATLFARKGAP